MSPNPAEFLLLAERFILGVGRRASCQLRPEVRAG